MKYGIWDKSFDNLVKNPNTNKPLIFEYPEQCLSWIKKKYNNSLNFTILKLK